MHTQVNNEGTQINSLFEHATEGIILTDGAGKIVLANPAALTLFHFTREELIGKPIEILIPTRLHHQHVQYRTDFYKHPTNRSMGHGRELKAKTKEGAEFPVEVSLSFYNQNNELFVIAFVIDITARKIAEQKLIQQKEQLEKITADIKILNTQLENKVEERTMILREALQQLEQSQKELHEALNKEKELNEIKSRFVTMASHEFRTPLSTILSSASLISKYSKEDEQPNRDKHVKRIKEAVKHLNELLEDFLSLGKLEEGKVKVEPGVLNLGDFSSEVIDEIKPVLKHGQEIILTINGSSVFNTDKRLVKNILINLLGNAIKFSPENKPILLVLNNGLQLGITVSDEGIGISEEDQQHLFSSFFRGNNASNIQGTGMGLHIVKRYVELLDGQISLKSTIGKGTSITVTLPLLS